MSTSTPITEDRLLHIWDVTVEKSVPETVEELINGSPAKVTRDVKKPVTTRMALKKPTRRELRAAELFYGQEFNRFVSLGFLPRSILINKHLDLTGGVLSQKEQSHTKDLVAKHEALEADLARLATVAGSDDQKKRVQHELAAVRAELININAANESVFSQTAEVKAQNQLSTWFAMNMIYIERDGKWTQYFEGDTFEKKEEFMWDLDEKGDPFYMAATDKIAAYVYWYSKGAEKSEDFKAMDEEMRKQAEARKSGVEKAAAPELPVQRAA